MSESKLQEWVSSSLERQREYARESLIVDAQEEIIKAMGMADVSKAELARLLECSRANIQQLLDGSHAMTLRKLADIAQALGCRAEVKLKKVR